MALRRRSRLVFVFCSLAVIVLVAWLLRVDRPSAAMPDRLAQEMASTAMPAAVPPVKDGEPADSSSASMPVGDRFEPTTAHPRAQPRRVRGSAPVGRMPTAAPLAVTAGSPMAAADATGSGRSAATAPVRIEQRDGDKYPLRRIASIGRDGATVEMVADHLLVRRHPDADSAVIDRALAGLDARIRRRLPDGERLLVAFDAEDPAALPAMRRRLAAQDWVAHVEPDYIVQHCGERDEPRYDELWGLENTGQTGGTADADIDAPPAWRTTRGSDQVVVAVIDTGIDYTHPDLAGNMWVNPAEIAGNGIDDDGNGFVDDLHGYDFFNDDADPMDDVGHGTHCAGTIGAIGDNGVGVVGVCPRVRLIALKFLGPSGGATSDAIASMHYLATLVRDHGVPVKVVNNSWGGAGRSDELADAIDELGDLGVLSVAAAGNSSRDNDQTAHFPSSYPAASLLSVAATNHDDERASFSNYGATSVDIAAPGQGIVSTVIDEGYESYNGTSMATPHVVGAAALLFAADPATATWQSVREALLDGVEVLSALDGVCVSGGRLNVARALLQTGAVPIHLLIDDSVGGDGDGLADIGETVDLRARVVNRTAEQLTDIELSASIVAPSSGVTVLQATASCGDLEASAQATSSAMRIRLAADLTVPQVVQLRLQVDSAQGSWTRVVGLPVGPSGGVSGSVALDGAPLAGSSLHYTGTIDGLASDDSRFDGVVQSAADGSYHIPIPEGDWQLQATYPGALASDTVDLSIAAQEARQQDFSFTTVSIEGQVRELLSGDPLADAEVSYADPISASTTTGSDGHYAFTEVIGRSIDLLVTCRHPDYFTASETRTLPPGATIDFQMGVADIRVDPTSVALELGPEESATVDLRIDNVGGSNLVWRLRDQVGRSRAGPAATAGEVRGSIAAPRSIAFFFGGQGAGGMAIIGNELWHCGWYGSDLLRVVDLAADGNELHEYKLPSHLIAHDLCYDGKWIWATSSWFDDYLFAIDPADGSVVEQFEAPGGLPGSEPKGIAYGDGYLWVSYRVTDSSITNDDGGNRIGDQAIQVIDPADGSLVTTLFADAAIADLDLRRMTYFAGCLWFIDDVENAILAVDAGDGSIRHRFDDPWKDTDYFTVGLVSDDRGSLWLGPNIRNSTQDEARLRQVDTGLRPWLTAAPLAGDTGSLASDTLQLTVTAAQASSGVNTGTVSIGSNDLDQPHLIIPVRLTIDDGNGAPFFTEQPTVDTDPIELPATGRLSAAAADPDGDDLTWYWFQQAGPGLASFDDTGVPRPTVSFMEPGQYRLAARVSDGHGASVTAAVAVTVTATGERRNLIIDPDRLELSAGIDGRVDAALDLHNSGWGPEGISWLSRNPIRGALLDTSPASVVVDSYGLATSGTHHYYFHGGLAIEKHHRDGGVVDIIKLYLDRTRIQGYGLDYEDGHIWVAALSPRFAIFKVEEATEQAVHAIDIPEGRIPTGISLDPNGEDIWCLAYARDGNALDDDDGMIYRLARLDGEVRTAVALPSSIPQDQGSVTNIAFIDGLVWVLRSYPNPERSPGQHKPLLYGVDPATGTVVETFKPHTDKVQAICRGDLQTMWQVEYEIATYERYAFQVNVSDIPWLRKDQETDHIAPRQQQTLTVTCDAAVAGLGRHEAAIAVYSDDPDEPVQYVPVVFTVSDNQAPRIDELRADPTAPLTSTRLTVQAIDPDGDPLSYAWQVVGQPSGAAPDLQPDATTADLVFDRHGDYRVRVRVSDGRGGSASEAIDLAVSQQATDLAIE